MRTETQRPQIILTTQAKYGALARGDAEVYLRLPKPGKRYEEKIWDHAAGRLHLVAAHFCRVVCTGEKIHSFIPFPASQALLWWKRRVVQ